MFANSTQHMHAAQTILDIILHMLELVKPLSNDKQPEKIMQKVAYAKVGML